MVNQLGHRPEFQPDDPAGERPASRILLADDSAIERRGAAMLLRDAGYEVDEADDGQAVLHFLRSSPDRFDLLLLDLNMPGMDGFDVLAHLQRQHAELPVILMSGLPPDQIQQMMHRLPMRSLPPLLLKPIDPEQMINVVSLKLSGELPA